MSAVEKKIIKINFLKKATFRNRLMIHSRLMRRRRAENGRGRRRLWPQEM
jgi:hypothetical protein